MAGGRKTPRPVSRRLPTAVRNLAALHSLTLESRFESSRNHRDIGRYDVLQKQQEASAIYGATITRYYVVCVIDLKDGEGGMVQDILLGLDDAATRAVPSRSQI